MKRLAVALAMAAGAAFGGDAELRAKFTDPPESARLQAWFHWISDCVTAEGLEADIKAMGEMEIGMAHVFMPSMAHLPVKCKPLTKEWFELWRTALREAKKRNMKIGFHNCPGWSSSGGPWITPENAMKCVVFTQTDVPAGGAEAALAQPAAVEGFYRDIAVMAFPLEDQPKLKAVRGDFEGGYGDFAKGAKPLVLPLGGEGKRCEVEFAYDREFAPETMVLSLDESQFYTDGEVFASAGGEWKSCGKFRYELFNAQRRSPKILKLQNPVKANRFKVSFRAIPAPPWVSHRPRKLLSCEFSNLPFVADVEKRNSATTAIGYVPHEGKVPAKGIAKGDWIDLTADMGKDGVLRIPEGKRPAGKGLRVLRIGYTCTGKKCAPATLPGLECDKLSRKGLDAHWPHMPKRLVGELPEAKGVVALSIIDSYEVGGQNWTEAMEEEFARRRGYSPRAYLPALAGYVVEDEAASAKFLYDFQRTVSDLFAENYYDYFAELCAREGIESAVEPYGGPFDSMRCGAKAEVPTGEFWLGRQPYGSPRVASSIGHLNGRSRIAAEAFTTEAKEGRWQVTPKELRNSGDRGWLEGISQLVYHSYLHQPFGNVQPGTSLGRHGTQLNRNTTWWREGVHWSRYVRRGQALLQSGRPRAEILLLAGESRPNFHVYPAAEVKAGYNFDYCGSADVRRLEAREGGRVAVPGGVAYEILHLGSDRYLTCGLLKEIERLAAAGVRIAGMRPLGSPSLADGAAEWKAAVKRLWDGGKVLEVSTPGEALAKFGIRPDADSAGRLRAIRREVCGRDVYFVANRGDGDFSGTVDFAVLPGAGSPELWDAVTGGMTRLKPVRGKCGDGRMKVKIDLPKGASAFVVFAGGKCSEFAEEEPVEFEDVKVLNARYCAKDGDRAGRDVTGVVAGLLAKGKSEFAVGNATLGKDPAPNRYKVLELELLVGGEKRRVEFKEHSYASLKFMRPPKKAEPERVLLDLSEGWTLSGFEGKNAPEGEKKYGKLESWSESADAKLKYFAGRATYRKTFNFDPGAAGAAGVALDLGDVRELANVRINGKFAACLWDAPYTVRADGFLEKGQNVIEVEVVNTWPNRLIGDAIARKNGAAEPMSKEGPWPLWVLENRPDSGTGIWTWSNFMGWKAEEPLLKAGMLGPVRLVARKYPRKAAKELETVTPESVGISSKGILDWIEACGKELDSLHSFVLMRKGKIAAEGYWAPYGPDRTHVLFSHSKSFTATAAGFLVQDGRLDLDETVASIFPEKLPPNPSENLLRMRVRDLLTMSTGSEKDSIWPVCSAEDGDWVAAFLRHPVERMPGTHFVYNTGATYMVAAIVEKKAGMGLVEYLGEKLFRRIGIEKAWSGKCPKGVACGGYGMNMTTRELARFGQFCLNGGKWEGEQILSKDWMWMMTTKQTESWRNQSDWGRGYGFQFWRCIPEGVYRADGAFGQLTVVMPEQEAVLSVTAGLGGMGKELELVWKHLLPAMKSGGALPEDAAAVEALRAKCAALAIRPVKGGAGCGKAFEKGRKYAAEGKSGLPWLEAVSLEPAGDGAWEISFHGLGRVQKVAAGNGKWMAGKMVFDEARYEKLGAITGVQDVVASGGWIAEGKFYARLQLVGGPASIDLQFDFAGEKPGAEVWHRWVMGKGRAKIPFAK